MQLTGKNAVVTGAASGIGKAVVAAFVREGAKVAAADRDFSGTASGTVDGTQNVRMDVSQEADWERVFKRIGRLDVLVGCAGISEAKAIAETSLEDWRLVMEVNLDGAFLSVKHAAKAMNEGGAIVLVGSASGIKAAPSVQRMAFPEEIADAIVFLSCDESAHITGADLVVDGGYTL